MPKESKENEESPPHQGGDVAAFQAAESRQPVGNAIESAEQPVTSVTGRDGGAKRSGFFRKRDY